MKLILFSISLLCCLTFSSFAGKRDTLVLSFAEFLKAVKENHPVSKQSELLIQSAEADVLTARGNFDPRLYYNIDQKQFDNKNYWSLQNGGVKIPTAVGLELSAGVEQSAGPYLNSESVSSVSGMVYTQFSVPLLQGLMIDERRAALKQSKLLRELSLVEQKNMLNELFSKASKTYWEWVQSYHNLQVFREAVVLANQRLQGIKQAALLGDIAAIDTLEAGIQYRERYVKQQQQEMDFYSKTMLLSVFLWDKKNEPAEFIAPVIPPAKAELEQTELAPNILSDIKSLVGTHPNILAYKNKNSRLALALKLKQDKLKPVVNIKFNPLYDIGNFKSSILYGVNSFKWGVGFQFPLLLLVKKEEK